MSIWREGNGRHTGAQQVYQHNMPGQGNATSFPPGLMVWSADGLPISINLKGRGQSRLCHILDMLNLDCSASSLPETSKFLRKGSLCR
jgi:hypothetical protein